MNRTTLIWITCTFMICILIGCSSNHENPITTDNQTDLINPVDQQSHSMLGEWIAQFNPETMEITVEQIRKPSAHFNLTSLIPRPGFQVISYDPSTGEMDVDATITNPYVINGFDVRLIVFTDSYGERLLNPEAWTSLYDSPGDDTMNPFRAYSTMTPEREFPAQSQQTMRLKVVFPPPGFPTIRFAIDGSYPGNCEEPYDLRSFKQDNLLSMVGSSAKVSIEVYDWQEDVNSVLLYCPDIIGTELLELQQRSRTLWDKQLINNLGASEGMYGAIIGATSSNSGSLALYEKVSIEVTGIHGWVKTWGSIGIDKAFDLAIDSNDNVYVSGRFSGEIDLDPGPGEDIYNVTQNRDIFMSKFDTDGEYLWGDGWNVDCPDYSTQVVVDTFDNSYQSGNSVDIRKHASTGGIQWTASVPGFYYNYALAMNSADELAYGGSFRDDADADPGPGVVPVSPWFDTQDSYINVLDENMSHLWVATIASQKSCSVKSLMFNDFDECFAVGDFTGTTDFMSGTGTDYRNSYGYLIELPDGYLSKYSSDGAYEWVQAWGAEYYEPPTDLAVNSSGEIFVVGYFNEYAYFDPAYVADPIASNGGWDVYITKFNASGDWVAAWTFGGLENDEPTGVAIDEDDSIYITGYYTGEVDFDPSSGELLRISNGEADAFVLKLDSSITPVWVVTFGGLENDCATDIAIDSEGMIIVCGYFEGIVDFDPGPGAIEKMALGVEDAFMMKLLPDGSI